MDILISKTLETTKHNSICTRLGGLIGLRLVAQDPENFAGLVVSNSGLPMEKAPVRASSSG